MKYEAVRLEALDFHDKTFLISPPVDDISIQNSVGELGVINPLSLRRNRDKYQIICGWRRIKACQQLGCDEIASVVYEMDELSDEDCLKFVLYENQRRLNDLDKAELILKFKRLCDYNDMDLIRKVLPLFGIGATRKNLERYMSLTDLESEITEACYREQISLEQLFSLSEVDPDERLEILRRILKRFKFNNNETRELIRDLAAVASRDKLSIARIIDRISSEIGGSGGKNEFRHELKRLRYPSLTRVEEHYKKCLSSFNLPKDVGIHHPPSFEGNELEIRVKFGTPERLSELLTYLSSVLDDGNIERLLNVVREGEQ